MIFDGFWVPLWQPFWVTFPYYLWFEVHKSLLGLHARILMNFDWKILSRFLWILMFQPLKSIVNIYVFMRFHFFDFFVILMTSGTSWDLILDTFGGLGRPFWWFVGVLDMHWNFIDFQDHPKLSELGCWRVNCWSRASSNRSISPACWPLDCQTPVCWLVDHQIVIADGMLEEYLKYDIAMNERITLTSDLKRPSSQPDGPWQAGAGG